MRSSVTSKKRPPYEYAVLAVMGILFYFCASGQWISLEDDSPIYLDYNGYEGVMPVYPAFLRLMKLVIGAEHYLDGVVVVQSCLAIVCTMVFVLALKKRFSLKLWEVILLYAACMLPFSIELPKAGITHMIMTEGLSYALFYLYFLFLINYVMDRKGRWGLCMYGMAIVLLLVRSQMFMLLLSSFAAFLYVLLRRMPDRKTAVKAALGLVCAAAAAGALLFAGLRTGKLQIAQLSSVVVIRGFYEAEPEDRDLFQTAEMQEAFDMAYAAADEQHYLYIHARKDLYMWKDLVCDRLPLVVLDALTQYITVYPEATLRRGDAMREMGYTLLFHHFGRYLYHTFRLMVSGFIAAVFWQIEPIYLLCHIITALIYLYAVAGSVLCLKKERGCPAAVFMLTVTGFILIMVTSVNLLFVGLQRYVVYAMGIFYCGAYLVLRELARLYGPGRSRKRA